MDTNNLSHLAKIISDLANSNLEQLQGKCQDEKDMQDYYLGILQKQALLLLDLSTILKNRQSKYISTPYIILRSLLDDFMHLMYLELSNNKEEEIIKINAEAYKHCFVFLDLLWWHRRDPKAPLCCRVVLTALQDYFSFFRGRLL